MHTSIILCHFQNYVLTRYYTVFQGITFCMKSLVYETGAVFSNYKNIGII